MEKKLLVILIISGVVVIAFSRLPTRQPAPVTSEPYEMIQANEMVMDVTLQKLTERASYIVIGRVTETRCYWNDDHTMIFTDVTLAPEQWIKDPENLDRSPITIRMEGGRVGNMVVDVSDSPSFRRGARSLLFLEKIPPNRYEVIYGSQGQIYVTDPSQLASEQAEGEKYLANVLSQIRYFMEETMEGTHFKQLSIDSLIDQAEFILTGRITNLQSYWSPDYNLILTDYAVIPELWIRTPEDVAPESLPIRGGEFDSPQWSQLESPPPQEGQEVLLFLRRTPEGRYETIGGYQGRRAITEGAFTYGRQSILIENFIQVLEDPGG